MLLYNIEITNKKFIYFKNVIYDVERNLEKKKKKEYL